MTSGAARSGPLRRAAVVPAAIATYSRLPTVATAALLWAMRRVPSIRRSGAAGPGEPRTLIDMMTAAAPDHTRALLAVRRGGAGPPSKRARAPKDMAYETCYPAVVPP